MKKLMLICLSLACTQVFADDSMEKWTKNFQQLVTILQQTQTVGDCNLALTNDMPQGSYLLEFTGHKDLTFGIVPPAATNGRTQADLLDGHILKYRQSDAIGWVNMIVKLDEAEQTILGLELNKTLPDGTVYDLGLVCGQVLN